MNRVLKMWQDYRDRKFLDRLNRVLANKDKSQEFYSSIKKTLIEEFEKKYCTSRSGLTIK